jgi:hypothetical protein
MELTFMQMPSRYKKFQLPTKLRHKHSYYTDNANNDSEDSGDGFLVLVNYSVSLGVSQQAIEIDS